MLDLSKYKELKLFIACWNTGGLDTVSKVVITRNFQAFLLAESKVISNINVIRIWGRK